MYQSQVYKAVAYDRNAVSSNTVIRPHLISLFLSVTSYTLGVANEEVDHFMEDTLICSVWEVTVLFVQEILKLFYNSPFLLVFVHTCSLHGRVSRSWKPRGELFLTRICPQTSV